MRRACVRDTLQHERGLVMSDNAATDGPDLEVTIDGRTSIRHAADGAFTIGRDQPPSDLSITHPAVSRLHLRLIPGAQQWCLVDYESLNGIYIDGARITRTAPIADGMTVHLANPEGVAVTFRYVHPEDITIPAPVALVRAGTQSEEPETTRYDRATAQLRELIQDAMAVPGPGQPHFASTTLRLLQRLGQLRTEFTELAIGDDQSEAHGFLICVEAMYNGLLIRMSACS